MVIKRWNREFSFAGHCWALPGVYSTVPRPASWDPTFRCELFHGITSKTDDELHSILEEAAQKFRGNRYNIVNRNANHFTEFFCTKLTNKSPPSWLHGAADCPPYASRKLIPKPWRTYIRRITITNVEKELVANEPDSEGRLWHYPGRRYGQLLGDLDDYRHEKQSQRTRANSDGSFNMQEDLAQPFHQANEQLCPSVQNRLPILPALDYEDRGQRRVSI